MSDDLISRKDAIDAFKPYADYESNRTNADWVRRIELVLHDLPSAQPKRTENTRKTHTCDCIDRQAAIDAIFSEPLYKSGMKKREADEVVPAIYEKIKVLPSAQPEIIHCGDCKYQDENWRRVSVRWLPCMEVRTGSNWYCGSAERRTDE